MFATRFAAAALSLCAIAALAACGGGGTAAVTPPAAVTTPVPPPTPTPSPYPSTEGDAFTYQGTYSQQYTIYGTPAPNPSGSASPQPTSTPWTATDSESVTQDVTLHAGAAFNGVSGLTEFDVNETDAGARSTSSIETKEYLQSVPDPARNGTSLTQVAADATDSNGVESLTTFGAGNGVLDKLPQVPQAQWSNGAARETVESDPSGEQIDTTYAADGTYGAKTTFAQGDTATISMNADGSGVYVLPFIGTPGSEITVSPVTQGAIDIAFKQAALGNVSWGSIPAWYPYSPAVYASDTFVDGGSVTIPSNCGVPSTIGSSGTRIDEQRLRIDTVYGEMENTTQSSYVVPPYGVVCTVLHDDLAVYYDYSGESTYLFSGTPLRQTISDETLGMTKAALAASASSRARAAVTSAADMTFVQPSTARVRLALAKAHLQFVRHVRAAMKETR